MANITLTPLPFSTPMRRPGAGAEDWHNGSAAVGNVPQPMDVYYRFVWNKVEKGQGQYDWTYLDGLIRNAINSGKKLSFGIMEHSGDSDQDGGITYDGAISFYPLYLHQLMQKETANSRDWANNGIWIPNFNSPNYIARLEALNQAVRDHLVNTKYTATAGPNKGKSITLGDAIYCIDIRGFGTWGEWHTSNGMAEWNAFPAGRQPTAASLKAIIDAHTKTLDKWPLVIMIAAYDAGSSQFGVFHPYPDVAYHALTAKNAWGAVGFRKDQWAARDQYLAKIAELNSKSFNGIPLRGLIMDKWKTAPVTGEPMPGTAADLSDLPRQINLYHATSFGNGNYGPRPNATQTEFVEEAASIAGHKLAIMGGTYTNTDKALNITLNWLNGGNCPTYENWDVILTLKGAIEITSKSRFVPKLFLPQPTPTPVSDTVAIAAPAGEYQLSIRVIDPTGYREPLPLYNEGRQADGSYNLGKVSIGGTIPIPEPGPDPDPIPVPQPNIAPVVSAGIDKKVRLPNNRVQLTGSATDKDGSIASVLWEIIAGSGYITDADRSSVWLEGLTEGATVVKFTATDNDGAKSSDMVTVTVLKAIEPTPDPDPDPEPVPTKTIANVTNVVTTTIHYSDGSTEKFPK